VSSARRKNKHQENIPVSFALADNGEIASDFGNLIFCFSALSQNLSELRHFLTNGGFSIAATVDARADKK
jgi:hypothetical protein